MSTTGPDETDAALVRRVLGGDVEAYAGLVARHRSRLARHAVHQLGDAADADEVVQDAFVRAYRALSRCADPARFGAWVFQILVNRCRTAGSRRSRRERLFTADAGALEGASVAPEGERAAWRDAIRWALAQLDAEQREAFLLKHVEDLSYEEMADLTGAGISALKMRVKRARARLQILLAEARRA